MAVCHVEEVVEGVDEEGVPGTWYIAHVIVVAEPAVAAHLAHGDYLAEEGAQRGDDCSWFEPAPLE